MWTALDRAAQRVSDRLVELARIKRGDRVLDIATGSASPDSPPLAKLAQTA